MASLSTDPPRNPKGFFFKKETAMRRNTFILVALMAAGTVLTIERTSRGQDAWRPPIEGLISHRNASLYYIKITGNTVVIYLPGEWGASSRGSSNAETKTFITDVTLKAKGKPGVSIKGGSAKPNQLVVNGKSFDLAAGSVLRVDAGGQVFQLPFQPLTPTHEYLQSLRKYISDREGGNR